MKHRVTIGTLLVAIAICIVATFGISHTLAVRNSDKVSLSLDLAKRNLQLGEIADISIELANNTNQSISTHRPSVLTGTIRLMISRDSVQYKKYYGPNWGSFHSAAKPVDIPPGESLRSKATVMYNEVLSLDHLSDLYAEPMRKERINTGYAFAESGAYWLKLVFDDGKKVIESEPVLINILEPTGDAAVIWNKIKSEDAYAYFLQAGDVKYYPRTPEYSRFLSDVRELSDQFPNTDFADRVESVFTERKLAAENLRKIQSGN